MRKKPIKPLDEIDKVRKAFKRLDKTAVGWRRGFYIAILLNESCVSDAMLINLRETLGVP